MKPFNSLMSFRKVNKISERKLIDHCISPLALSPSGARLFPAARGPVQDAPGMTCPQQQLLTELIPATTFLLCVAPDLSPDANTGRWVLEFR